MNNEQKPYCACPLVIVTGFNSQNLIALWPITITRLDYNFRNKAAGYNDVMFFRNLLGKYFQGSEFLEIFIVRGETNKPKYEYIFGNKYKLTFSVSRSC